MAVHDEILRAALRICRQRGGWRFRPSDIVLALPHLNPRTVLTHIVSRCCVNAPAHHAHRLDYFRRVSRGVYEIRSPYRHAKQKPTRRATAEPRTDYAAHGDALPRETVHAVVRRSRGWYVGECLEVAVVSQGRTLDELVEGLREAVALHLEGEDSIALGLVPAPRLAVTYELPARTR
jgi:predicted RNase H-like HicB family nuclease